MSKATVNATMQALKAKNSANIAEGTESNKKNKRKEALQDLADTKKNGGRKRKPPAKKLVVSSSDEEADDYRDIDRVYLNKDSGTDISIPREIVLANSTPPRVVDVGDRCTCSPASLTDSYEKGVAFCACFRVNLWQMRVQSRGVDRYTMMLRDLSRKYCKKKLKHLDPPDISIYNPSDIEEPSQQELDAEEEAFAEVAVKTPGKGKKKGKAFISREAVEDKTPDPEDEAYDPAEHVEPPEVTPEPPVKKAKKTNNTPVVTAATITSAEVEEIEEVNSKKPPVKRGIESRLCPVCGSWMGISLDKETGETKLFCITCGLPWYTCDNMHIVLTTLDLNLHPSFTYRTKGLPPLCKEHQYPARLYIFDYKEYKDKKGNIKPVSEERQMLKGRIFFVCGAPEEITKATSPKGRRCSFVMSAEFKGRMAAHFEALYNQEVLEVREAKQEGIRNYLHREKMERNRQQALRKARLARWASLGLPVDDE